MRDHSTCDWERQVRSLVGKPGFDLSQHGCGQHIGMQPQHVTQPEQTGLNALYCRMHSTVQHLPQPQPNQAEAFVDARPSMARLNMPARVSFFMVVGKVRSLGGGLPPPSWCRSLTPLIWKNYNRQPFAMLAKRRDSRRL